MAVQVGEGLPEYANLINQYIAKHALQHMAIEPAAAADLARQMFQRDADDEPAVTEFQTAVPIHDGRATWFGRDIHDQLRVQAERILELQRLAHLPDDLGQSLYEGGIRDQWADGQVGELRIEATTGLDV